MISIVMRKVRPPAGNSCEFCESSWKDYHWVYEIRMLTFMGLDMTRVNKEFAHTPRPKAETKEGTWDCVNVRYAHPFCCVKFCEKVAKEYADAAKVLSAAAFRDDIGLHERFRLNLFNMEDV